MLGTYRDTESVPGDPLSAFLADIWRGPAVERLSLTGLGEDDVGTFLEATGSQANDPGALARAVHAETNGNPFFAAEVVRHLNESGASLLHDGHLPQSVREVVKRRLTRLSEGANRILRLASVVGQDFDLEVLEATGEDEALDAVEEASAARVVLELTPGHYRFAHAIVRSAVYDGLGVARRARLHRHVGEAIERSCARRLEQHLPALAHHFGQASSLGGPEKAIDYAGRAGDAAFAAFAFELAALYFRQALELVQRGSCAAPEHIDLLLGLGWSRMAAGDIPGTKDAALEAAAASRPTGDAASLAKAAILFASWSNTTSLGDDSLLEEALALLGHSNPSLRARLLGRLSYSRSYTGEGIHAGPLAEEAIRLAELANDREALGQALNGRFATLWGSHRVADRLAVINRLAGVAAESRASGTTTGRFRAVGWRLWRDELLILVQRAATYLELGDGERFRKVLQKLRSLERNSWYARANRAALEVLDRVARGTLRQRRAADADDAGGGAFRAGIRGRLRSPAPVAAA